MTLSKLSPHVELLFITPSPRKRSLRDRRRDVRSYQGIKISGPNTFQKLTCSVFFPFSSRKRYRSILLPQARAKKMCQLRSHNRIFSVLLRFSLSLTPYFFQTRFPLYHQILGSPSLFFPRFLAEKTAELAWPVRTKQGNTRSIQKAAQLARRKEIFSYQSRFLRRTNAQPSVKKRAEDAKMILLQPAGCSVSVCDSDSDSVCCVSGSVVVGASVCWLAV